MQLRRAGTADAGAVAEFYAGIPMEADLSLAVERRGDLAALYALEADAWETWLADDDGAVAGCASLLAREGYLGGERTTVGYLGDLRARPFSRAGVLLDASYARVLRDFAARTGAVAFGTAVIASNEPAVKALVQAGGRRRPTYTELLRYDIRSVHLTARVPRPDVRRRERRSGVQVRAMTPGDLVAVAELLDREARRHAFGTPMTADVLRRRLASWPGLGLDCFLLAERHGTLAGCLGVWDPRAVKQTLVRAYRGSMSRLKRTTDVLFPLVRAARLPEPGGPLRMLYATHQAVTGDDPLVLGALVDAAYDRWRHRGFHTLTFAVPGQGPLAGAFAGLHVTDVPAVFYAVTPPDEELPRGLTSGPPAFEIAML